MKHKIRIEGLVISSQHINVADFTDCYENIINNVNLQEYALKLFHIMNGIGKQSQSAILTINELKLNFENYDVEWDGPPNSNFEEFRKEFHRLRNLLVFT